MKIFIFGITLLTFQGDCFKINLAFKKNVYFVASVGKESVNRRVVDGNVNCTNSQYDNNNNADDDETKWIIVDLERPYGVDYVTVYLCPTSTDINAFEVILSNDRDLESNKTGLYKCPASDSTNPRNITCIRSRRYFRYVMVKQNLLLTLSEIEVYGEYINYVGCFKTLSNNNTKGKAVRLENCIEYCGTNSYAGMKNETCFCGNDRKHNIPLSECNILCHDNTSYCGGSNEISVYEVFPLQYSRNIKRNYVGCFKDNNYDRDLEYKSPDNEATLDKCQKICAEKNYLFFGVQFSSECFCGNNYGKHGISNESSCASNCTNNPHEVCGGVELNSIYAIYSENSNYFKTTHQCKDGLGLNSDGICENHECKLGWQGYDCASRDCSINRGECGDHECRVVHGLNVSECICKGGFDKKFWWHGCHDIDECGESSHTCHKSITTCVNTNGSYECQCSAIGHEYINDTCIDIDECRTKIHKCNTTTTDCINILGSYSCKCKDGFTNESLYSCADIDECEGTISPCNMTMQNCTNTFGSYECRCLKEGLTFNKIFGTCETSSGSSMQEYLPIIMTSASIIIGVIIMIIVILFIFKKCPTKRFTNGILIKDNENNVTVENKNEIDAGFQSIAVALKDLKDFYQSNKTELLNDFEKFPKISSSSLTNYGKSIKLKAKNKYKNIIPFDHNRVILKQLMNDPSSDYINASFIPSYTGTFQFIAAQGPIDKTEYDFWRMIVEYKVEIIVMLTNCVENGKIKCVQYWPNKSSKNIGGIKITFESMKIWSSYEIRKFKVTKDDMVLEVTHMWYKCWYDHRVPDNVGSLINFHHSLENVNKMNAKSPVVVHCSAGVGRTGTFIGINHLINHARQTNSVDVSRCLKFLREQRNHMIQTKVQFEFLFDALNFYHEFGDTTSVKLTADNHRLIMNEEKIIRKEFEWIVQAKPCDETNNSIYRNDVSKDLFFPGCVNNSVYKIHFEVDISWQGLINVCNGDNESLIIITNDLVAEKIVELPVTSKLGNLFLNTITSGLSINHIELMKADQNDHVYTNTDKMNILAIESKTTQEWNHLWTTISKFQRGKKIILLCTNNMKRAGFVISILNLLEMMETVEEIDVFQVVLQLKNVMKEFPVAFDEYFNLYSCLTTCLPDSGRHYANFRNPLT